MKISFIFIVAGCATTCRHCHSNGGPGPLMDFDQFRIAIDNLKPVVTELAKDNEIEIEWNYEPLSHPDFHLMLRYVRDTLGLPDAEGDYWPTSGFGLVSNPNADVIVEEIMNNGTKEIHFTLTGNRQHHNENVRNPRAFETFLDAAKRAHEYGLKTLVRLILQRDMLSDLSEIRHDLDIVAIDKRTARVSNYRPTPLLRELEHLRPSVNDLKRCQSQIAGHFNDTEDQFWFTLEENTEKAILSRILTDARYGTFEELDRELLQWKFVTVTPELIVYMGMPGFPTDYVGDLKTRKNAAMTQRILDAQLNFGIGAYFALDRLPSVESIVKDFGDLNSEKLYRDSEDVLAKCLDTAHQIGSTDAFIVRDSP
jgi:MoaA/NifB/PqqE/SkfB family radical SAM enzyme